MKKTILIPTFLITALVVIAFVWTSNPSKEENTSAIVEQAAETYEKPPTINASPTVVKQTLSSTSSDEITWMSWDEAVAANEKSPKMLFVDVYTDWCGWCKVMDRQTFTDPKVVAYMNQNYYAIKFNAEKEAPISFRGQEYKVVEAGRRGIHTLAYALLEGQLSYPSYVYLNADFQRLNVSKGFKPAEPFLAEMQSMTKAYEQ